MYPTLYGPWVEKGAETRAATFIMAWTIGRLFGIPVRLHFTMVLVPFLTYNWMPVSGLPGFLIWASVVVLLFGSVLLHEFGHALTARRFGISTQDIVLTPIGGIARVTSMPQNPKQEIAIAAAGPIVSLLLAGTAFSLFFILPFIPFVPAIVMDAVTILFGTNLVLALFNLIPALPMDGGRVLRGILALKRDHLTATRIAVKIGRTLAVIGMIYALVESRLNLGLIAVFIYIAAGSELRAAEFRAAQEKMRDEGRRPFGFPFGPAAAYTWSWRSGRPAVRPDRAEYPVDLSGGDEWSKAPERLERDVVVVGGKAEIIGRKDPEK